jgi:nitrate/nitrite transport system ATP-binding protein
MSNARYLPPMLELDRLAKGFANPNGRFQLAVKEFSLKISQGEFCTLIGHSGCGKSTVLSMVAGLLEATSGGIIANGREVTEAGPDRAVVFQSPSLLPWLSALDNVLLGVDQAYFTASKQERRELAEYYLHAVGLADQIHAKPASLSQGMRQRVGIARAFALQPKILLLDEPFGMLDALTKLELHEVLLDLWKRFQITTLMVTHDVDEALILSDRVIMMTDGPEAELGDIMRVPFDRPRDRKSLMDSSKYHELREQLHDFLNDRSHIRPSQEPSFTPSADLAEEWAHHSLKSVPA